MKPVLKFFLITFNALITVFGVGLTLVGVVVKFNTEMIDGYLATIVKVLPAGGGTGSDVWKIYNMNAIALIVFGIAVGISGFVGCFAVTCGKRKVTISYLVIMSVLMLAQLTSAGLILTMNIGDDIKTTLKSNLVRYYAGDQATDDYSAAWNYAFVEFSCCGAESYTDFKLTILWDREETYGNGSTYLVTVPVTCCKLPGDYPDFGNPYNESCQTDPSTGNSYYNENCSEKIDDYLQYYAILMSCPCIGAIVVEGLALALLLAALVEMKNSRIKVKQALAEEYGQ